MKTNTLRAQKAGDIESVRGRQLMYKNLVVSLYMKGHSVEKIRELAELETGHRYQNIGVYRWIGEAITEWEKQKDHFITNHKAIELERVNRLEVEYWEGYERSRKILKSKTRVKVPGKDDGKMKVAKLREEDRAGGAGDVRFLNGIQWCIDKRCEILGITTPLVPIINNQQNNITDNRTMIVRRNIFKTRETTTAMQVLPEATDE
jgi:hypothetical protein